MLDLISNIELVPETIHQALFDGYVLVSEGYRSETHAEDVYSKDGKSYTLISTIEHNHRNGKAELFDSDNRIVALYTFVNDYPNGPCKLFNNMGSVVFSGNIRDGLVNGLFYEYYSHVQEPVCSLYHDGVRIPLFEAIPDKPGYFF